MRSLVTGGAGFIGSHLAHTLVKEGHEVLVVDDLSSGHRDNVPTGAEFAQVNVTTPEVEQVVTDFAPQAIFHLAAQMDVRKSVTDPVFDARANVGGTVRVVSAGARAGVETVVLASTGGALYGEQDTFPATEAHPTRPESPYGVSKLCAELYLGYFARSDGLRAVALRFANVYGPRQDPHGEAGVVAIFAGKCLQAEQPTIYGDGGQTRDYVYVDDVVQANLAVLASPKARGPYNIGTGIETNVNVLADHIAKAAGYAGGFAHGPARDGEQRRSVVDAGRARQELEWEPQTELVEGLTRTVAWFRKRQSQEA